MADTADVRTGDVRKDPRYLEAVRMFDMWDWGWGMPSDPHARENLRHACGWLAADGASENAAGFTEVVLTRYLGGKYRHSARTELRRIARAASASKDAAKEEKGES